MSGFKDSIEWAALATNQLGRAVTEIARGMAAGETPTNASYRAHLRAALVAAREAEQWLVRADVVVSSDDHPGAALTAAKE